MMDSSPRALLGGEQDQVNSSGIGRVNRAHAVRAHGIFYCCSRAGHLGHNTDLHDRIKPEECSIGRQCLLARGLVERGVRFTEVLCPSVGHDR